MREILLTLSLLSLVADAPRPPHDMVELNRVLYDNGGHLDQLIAWNWDEWSRSYVCDGYACVARDTVLAEQRHNHYRIRYEQQGRRYAVLARQYRETVTPWDPEILDRRRLPCGQRRGF